MVLFYHLSLGLQIYFSRFSQLFAAPPHAGAFWASAPTAKGPLASREHPDARETCDVPSLLSPERREGDWGISPASSCGMVLGKGGRAQDGGPRRERPFAPDRSADHARRGKGGRPRVGAGVLDSPTFSDFQRLGPPRAPAPTEEDGRYRGSAGDQRSPLRQGTSIGTRWAAVPVAPTIGRRNPRRTAEPCSALRGADADRRATKGRPYGKGRGESAASLRFFVVVPNSELRIPNCLSGSPPRRPSGTSGAGSGPCC